MFHYFRYLSDFQRLRDKISILWSVGNRLKFNLEDLRFAAGRLRVKLSSVMASFFKHLKLA